MGKVSRFFSWEELITTSHRDIDNSPPPELEDKLIRLAEFMDDVREILDAPVHVNSAYRSPELNTHIGGRPDSQHCKAEAMDFVVPSMPLKEAFEIILHSGLPWDQLIYEGTWIHCSFPPSSIEPDGTLVFDRPPRGQALMYGSWTGKKYLPYDSSKIP